MITLEECRQSIGCEVRVWEPGRVGVICRGRILSVGRKYLTVICYVSNLPRPVKLNADSIVEFI